MARGDAPPVWTRRVGAFVLLVVSAGVFFEAQRQFRADWTSAAARHRVVEWASGPGAPAHDQQQWEDVREALEAALAITPGDPALHERLGDAFFAAGQRDWQREAISRKHFAQATVHYGRAIELRPAEPGTWAMLASALQAAGSAHSQIHEAWARALKLGPFEGHVQPVLLQVVLTDWDSATPAMQDWAKSLFDRSSQSTQNQINALAKPYGLAFAPDKPASAP